MTPAQVEVRRIEDANLARLLSQETDFLAQFVDPHSPSEVAARMDMAANLAHHHARKLADAGLLFEQRREGGKVYYQLGAREFRVPSRLLPPGDWHGNGSADIRQLAETFMRAYERSWATMHEGEEDVFGFGSAARPATTPCSLRADALSLESHPAHLDALSLRLSPERYQRLARALSALLAEAAAGGHSPEAQPCTLAVLTFQLPSDSPGSALSHTINSFLAAPPQETSPR